MIEYSTASWSEPTIRTISKSSTFVAGKRATAIQVPVSCDEKFARKSTWKVYLFHFASLLFFTWSEVTPLS